MIMVCAGSGAPCQLACGRQFAQLNGIMSGAQGRLRSDRRQITVWQTWSVPLTGSRRGERFLSETVKTLI